jgi:hypothetical protein
VHTAESVVLACPKAMTRTHKGDRFEWSPPQPLEAGIGTICREDILVERVTVHRALDPARVHLKRVLDDPVSAPARAELDAGGICCEDVFLYQITGGATASQIDTCDRTVADHVFFEDVYVASLAQPGNKTRISVGGGSTPRWRADGRELFYAAADNHSVLAVAVNGASRFVAGTPKHLFTIGQTPAARDRRRNVVYDVTTDGARFLVSIPAGEPSSSRVTVVMNWTAALRP